MLCRNKPIFKQNVNKNLHSNRYSKKKVKICGLKAMVNFFLYKRLGIVVGNVEFSHRLILYGTKFKIFMIRNEI